MGSGTSSQVKAIENKTTVSSIDTVSTGKEATAPVSRTVANPTAPDTALFREETVPPSEVMVVCTRPGYDQKPASIARQSLGDIQTTAQSQSTTSASSSDLELKLAQVQKELNESESEKLDLHDRIQALEERLEELTAAAAADGHGTRRSSVGEGRATDLQETLKAKDLFIQQMEKQLTAAEAESKKVRMRLKKRIKTLTAQLSEARQESSIVRLEMKERNADLQEQLRHSGQAGSTGAMEAKPSGEEHDNDNNKDSKMKVILDLSAEVSEQSGRISTLERMLRDKDKEIERLKREAAQRLTAQNEWDGQVLHAQTGHQPGRALPQPGHGPPRHAKFSGPSGHTGVAPVETVRDYMSAQSTRPGTQGVRPVSKPGTRPAPLPEELKLTRQSTALSDSDSDWEVDMNSAKIHSAPARVRVKSAATSAEDRPADGGDRWSVVTDDNDLPAPCEARPGPGSHSRQKRRSALKTRLERERNERSRGLMGPSLAFAAPPGDQLSDVSATPTPRHAQNHARDMVPQFTTSDVMAFAV